MTRLWPLVLFTCLALIPRLARADAPTRRVAVLVGANEPPQDRSALRYAHDDAREMADVLESVGGFARGDVKVLLDPHPDDLLAALDEASHTADAAGGNVLFVFYYSGHSDGQALYPHGEALPVSRVRDRVERLGARIRIGILDTCRGGSWTQSKGLSVGPPLPIADLLNTDTEGTALVSSSSGVENAHEAASVRGSFFTHYLAAGLRGAADRKGDGNITLQEAFDYAREHTVRDSALVATTPQHPSFDLALRGRQDVVLTVLSPQTSALAVSVSRAAFEVIQLASGITVLDSPATTAPVRVALPAGRYLVRSVIDGQVYAHEVVVTAGTTVSVGDKDLVATGDARLAMKGLPDRNLPLSLWSPRNGSHWLVLADGGAGGDASPPSNLNQTSAGAQSVASLTVTAAIWWRITERLSWNVPYPAFAYRIGNVGSYEIKPYVGFAANSYNTSTGLAVGATGRVDARIWTTQNQTLVLGVGLVAPMYTSQTPTQIGNSGGNSDTETSSSSSVGLGEKLEPFVSVGYAWSVKNVVTLGGDVLVNQDYDVRSAADPRGYQATWVRIGAEAVVRVSRNAGISLRAAWSQEVHAAPVTGSVNGDTTSTKPSLSCYPGFLIGPRIAF